MKTLAVTVRFAALALTAALGSTAFAQAAGQDQAGFTLAMNDAPLIENREPTLAATSEQVQARSMEQELVMSVEAIAEKLNEKLEAKMAEKLELAI